MSTTSIEPEIIAKNAQEKEKMNNSEFFEKIKKISEIAEKDSDKYFLENDLPKIKEGIQKAAEKREHTYYYWCENYSFIKDIIAKELVGFNIVATGGGAIVKISW